MSFQGFVLLALRFELLLESLDLRVFLVLALGFGFGLFRLFVLVIGAVVSLILVVRVVIGIGGVIVAVLVLIFVLDYVGNNDIPVVIILELVVLFGIVVSFFALNAVLFSSSSSVFCSFPMIVCSSFQIYGIDYFLPLFFPLRRSLPFTTVAFGESEPTDLGALIMPPLFVANLLSLLGFIKAVSSF